MELTVLVIFVFLIAIPLGIIVNNLIEEPSCNENLPAAPHRKEPRKTSLKYKLDNMEDPADLDCAIRTLEKHCFEIDAWRYGVGEGFKSIFNELVNYYENAIKQFQKDIDIEESRHRKYLEKIHLDAEKYAYDEMRLKQAIKEWKNEFKEIGWEEKRFIKKYERKLAKLKGDKRWLIRKWMKVHLSDDEHFIAPSAAHELDLPEEEH
jgi:hypothetical protein